MDNLICFIRVANFMRILFIGQKGIPATFGGVEYHVEYLSQGLAARGHNVSVYVRPWYTPEKIDKYHGVKLIRIPTIKTKHLDASLHSFLCSIHALFSRADIIHYHALGPSFFAVIPWLAGKKIVTTVHRLDWETEKWGWFAKQCLKLGEWISTFIPRKTIVVSTDLNHYFRRHYRKNTIHIHQGINIPLMRKPEIIKKKYGLEGRDYILFMGRLSPEKRIDWLIQSFSQLHTAYPSYRKIKLVIAGGSSATESYISELKKLSRNNKSILFTGYVNGKEKDELFSNALIFSLPSYVEGSPIALLEAMGSRLCCLASDIIPHKEVVADGVDGLLFDSNKHSDLTQKLLDLISHPEKIHSLGLNAKQKIKQRLRWDDVAVKTEKVYLDSLGRHSPEP